MIEYQLLHIVMFYLHVLTPNINLWSGFSHYYWCLVLLQVPKIFVPIQVFWASSKIWLHLVPAQKLVCQHKKQFYWMQIIFLSGTKCLWLVQYVNKFLVWYKKFGPAQNILGPVKGQGISEFTEQTTYQGVWIINDSLYEIAFHWTHLLFIQHTFNYYAIVRTYNIAYRAVGSLKNLALKYM